MGFSYDSLSLFSCFFLSLQDMRCSLLAQIQSAPSDVLEELKIRLQLKDRLFQEVLADRTQQAKEHHEQVQDLLRTISSRDQYIQVEWRSSVESLTVNIKLSMNTTMTQISVQVSGSRLGEVLGEQAGRLMELRRQLSSGVGWGSDSDSAVELQAVQEELRLALRRERERERESQELSRSQASREEALSRRLQGKEEIIRVSVIFVM